MKLRDRYCLPIGIIALAWSPSIVHASGSSTPPPETSFSAVARCGFGEAELKYSNLWNPRDGHQSSIRSLQLKTSATDPTLYPEAQKEIEDKFFQQQEKIEKISAACYEENSVIFSIYLSRLTTDAGKRAWQAGPTIYIRLGGSGASVSSSAGE